mmetsp:Transcript_38285/g.43452  ORF Transcript_38285/g.43452 Transcript_38285/m.43452 type:complete len:211 (-) Transcript_38285:564-1196(-)
MLSPSFHLNQICLRLLKLIKERVDLQDIIFGFQINHMTKVEVGHHLQEVIIELTTLFRNNLETTEIAHKRQMLLFQQSHLQRGNLPQQNLLKVQLLHAIGILLSKPHRRIGDNLIKITLKQLLTILKPPLHLLLKHLHLPQLRLISIQPILQVHQIATLHTAITIPSLTPTVVLYTTIHTQLRSNIIHITYHLTINHLTTSSTCSYLAHR